MPKAARSATDHHADAELPRLGHVHEERARRRLQQNRVINQLDEWKSPEVTRLLLEKKNGKVTSYIAREMKTIDKATAKGTLIPYPQDRLA